MGLLKNFINDVKIGYKEERMRTHDERIKKEEEARQKGKDINNFVNSSLKTLFETPIITRTTTTKLDFNYRPKWRVNDGMKDLFEITEIVIEHNDGRCSCYPKDKTGLIPEGYFLCGFCHGLGFYTCYGDSSFEYDRKTHTANAYICPVCGGWGYIPDFRIKCSNCGDIHLASLDSNRYGYSSKGKGKKIIGNFIIEVETDRKGYPTWKNNIFYDGSNAAFFKEKCHKCGEYYKIKVRFKDLEKSYLE